MDGPLRRGPARQAARPGGRGITKRISPHSLRPSFITAALDVGVPRRHRSPPDAHRTLGAEGMPVRTSTSIGAVEPLHL